MLKYKYFLFKLNIILSNYKNKRARSVRGRRGVPAGRNKFGCNPFCIYGAFTPLEILKRRLNDSNQIELKIVSNSMECRNILANAV
jgi:hypothetical protein